VRSLITEKFQGWEVYSRLKNTLKAVNVYLSGQRFDVFISPHKNCGWSDGPAVVVAYNEGAFVKQLIRQSAATFDDIFVVPEVRYKIMGMIVPCQQVVTQDLGKGALFI
jgi:hypothetical protein